MRRHRHPKGRRATATATRAQVTPVQTRQAAELRSPRPVGAVVAPPAVATPPATRSGRSLPRGLLLAVLSAACVLVAGGWVVWAVQRQAAPGGGGPAGAAPAVIEASAVIPAGGKPFQLVFRSTALGDTYGKLMHTDLAASTTPPTALAMQCDRLYMAAGQGLCLMAQRGVFTTYSAATFGPDFTPRQTFPLSGIPSRARVSPDGRVAAVTVFVSGHSYAAGNFSTKTTLIDTATGAVLVEDLEQFTVMRDGARIQAPDMNFWGVTFARDGNRFYATLGTGGKTYLIEGDVAARQARVVYENVECPSLSPDNTRIAFKRRTEKDGRTGWQVSVLDLATLTERSLAAEARSVDDQVEWLDDDHLLYALPDDTGVPSAATNVWVLPADGSGPPQLLLARAESPAVLR